MAIPLSRGLYTLVDGKNYKWLSQWKWCVGKSRNTFYAVRAQGIYMHRLILDVPTGVDCDHISGDGLDNRETNLRPCTNQQNQGNRKTRQGGSSKYRGVHWHKCHQKWVARIGKERKHLGYYNTEEKAAKAFDRAAQKRFGEFAVTNFE